MQIMPLSQEHQNCMMICFIITRYVAVKQLGEANNHYYNICHLYQGAKNHNVQLGTFG